MDGFWGFAHIFLHAKKADFRRIFFSVGLNSTSEQDMYIVLTAICKSLFFEKVRFQYDLIFLYFMNSISFKLFV